MTKEELKNSITEVVRKNDMRNRHGKNLHILLGILDYIIQIYLLMIPMAM
jgi:hypothetical protein